ncbi:MAG: serine/threonine-protein kinase [Deltaproteobacteria bacterium]|nr:serine/threonine-protein kinase [Deltaproteobacteria bacterium]
MSVSRERSELRGQILDGRYRVGNPIGIGGTGIVFEAERLATLERVVVKMLRPAHAGNPDLMARVRREVEVARRVFHPGIVPVIDHGTLHDESPYVVMKYMRSESLATYLRRSGPLTAGQISVIMARLASILHSVHRHGYVHRDIKPEHILMNRGAYGELDVHLLDFGVCAAETAPAEERSRERGRVYGTPSYASPEQASGNPFVDARADLFGVGITMFEALTGRLPFTGHDVNAVLRRIIREDAPPASLLSPHVCSEMDQLLSKLLSRNPAARYPSARALMRALEPWLQERVRTERMLAESLQVATDTSSIRPTAQHEVAA